MKPAVASPLPRLDASGHAEGHLAHGAAREHSGELQRAVMARQLQMVYERLRLSVALTVVIAIVFGALLYSFFPLGQMVAWQGVMLVVSTARFAMWRAWTKSAHDSAALHRWDLGFVAGAFTAGAGWAVGPVLMMPPAGHLQSMLLLGTVLCVCSVAAVTLAARLPALVAFLVAAMVPTAWAMYATGGRIEAFGALIVLTGLGCMAMVGRVSNGTITQSIETQWMLSKAVEDVRRERERAEAASLAKTRFLANMSHELRSPLNAVIGAAQLLQTEGQDAQSQAQLVEGIQSSGANLLGLIENIMDLSRIEAGELRLVREDFHLADVAEGALATAALAARVKGLGLACIIDPALPLWRHGDPLRLRQVILNLLGNAVKFTTAGDVVLHVSAGTGRDGVRLSVSDTGIGIEPAAQARLFEPFHQADDSASRRYGGSGLGLAIVRQVVEAMGGRVGVHSRPGEGARFDVDLSLPAALQAVVDPPRLDLAMAYVEPHESSAQALQSLLTRLGCEVQRCRSAQDLHAWLGSHGARPERCWVLADVDGDEAMGILEAAADVLEPRRVIGMSRSGSHEADAARERFLLQRQVIKPVTRSVLVSRLRAAVAEVDAVHRGTAPPAVPASVAAPFEERPPHVLVVEDDPLNQAIVCRLLQHAGCMTSAAGNGETALAMVAARQFDMVLMDWQMPDLDGLEVTRRMRAGVAGAQGRSVPIVALTANAFAEDRSACLAAGMNDFLTKPVQHARLLEAVHRWTGLAVDRPATRAAAASTATAC
jgi:signal transduction histidine kinase/CheY-like chemotaxis protein